LKEDAIVSIAKTSRLQLYKKVATLCYENHKELANTLLENVDVIHNNAGGIYYHLWA
jgi:hypothetical protein